MKIRKKKTKKKQKKKKQKKRIKKRRQNSLLFLKYFSICYIKKYFKYKLFIKN